MNSTRRDQGSFPQQDFRSATYVTRSLPQTPSHLCRNCYKPLGCLQPTGTSERAPGWCRSPRGTRVSPPHASTAAQTRRQNTLPFSGQCQSAEVTTRPQKMRQPKRVWKKVTQDSELLCLPVPAVSRSTGPRAGAGSPADATVLCSLGRRQESTGPRPGRGECT